MARKTIYIDPRQLELFEAPKPPGDQPGALNIKEKVLETVTSMINDCPLSRIQVAERMEELTGQRITEAMLNAWTAESKNGHRFPLEYLPALELATGSKALTNLMVELAGREVYYGQEALKARLGKLEIEKAELAENIKTLKQKARTA